MSHRNHLTVPHPVLSSQRTDYAPDCHFGILMPHCQLGNGGKDIIITIKFQLRSPMLQRLIDERQACFCILIECYRTYLRESYDVWEDEEVLVLDRQDWQDSIYLTPYITAKEKILGFKATEHSSLVQTLAPRGVDLPAGAILAIGEVTEITIEDEKVESILQLVPNSSLEPGMFDTDLTGQRIAINLHPDYVGYINTIRGQTQRGPLLHQALYLHALDKAVRNLFDHSDKRWASVIEKALEGQGILADEEDYAENSERYAQVIFQKPLERMIHTLQKDDADE